MILADKQILALSLVSGIFEGSMYIFVFLKFAALRHAHALLTTQGKITTLDFTLS